MNKSYFDPQANYSVVRMRSRNGKDIDWKLRFVELTLIAAERSGRLQLENRAILRRGEENSVEIYFRP